MAPPLRLGFFCCDMLAPLSCLPLSITAEMSPDPRSVSSHIYDVYRSHYPVALQHQPAHQVSWNLPAPSAGKKLKYHSNPPSHLGNTQPTSRYACITRTLLWEKKVWYGDHASYNGHPASIPGK
ncbi:hypothetical protein BDY19DRAFT_587736 [Irpex rosettiformis]|uniref:Uncharacterized protein n=1 Tax=Irpex rosettiformis TaxID=378272 RepID=A0ACB8UDA2_9APHY|nr:hypothetical protein BDY19DRAFT_587736 [Irpex rosettiformis]